ncbi:MAG: Nif3-like dinuclear metal center hexameric protein [Ignavibacteria bacterium GWB2_35_12]|nr:MAG: Nif3-like dinuclear metal center hexameric protein [Ignavibacteria bacterium GWA2_35_8]OGU42251.1 MAG: Nif3-like dinuclear metal center hexameric protein [Ignavibacteria bacterium GWB2_35_12]OGU93516.1 MAG: Nif3-like dinuclear metal center hexameric protein [Ignavibacteria bacterium RIFOXYA2_FULL_35_10]OGV20054.1 MAG: Nif3-like dinuclear metal center hexameric protein [Ignavibacteria bacterium RIFOXYC2_FULL_35_21]
MRLDSLLNKINNILPQDSGIEGDRLGLQIQSGRNNVSNILITMEVDKNVINEAIKLKCDCIITFHPLIYNPLLKIHDNDRVGYLTSELIKNSIALISIHTNFDAFSEGTSKIFADKLGFKFEEFLIKSNLYNERGIGVIASVNKPVGINLLLKRINTVCNSPIKHSSFKINKIIKKIAIVGGSGSGFINEVLDSGVDAFITADISYHHYHQVFDRLVLIDPGHYEMEQFVPNGIAQILRKYFQNELKINVSSVLTNPVHYFPKGDIYCNKQKKYLINSNKKMVQN